MATAAFLHLTETRGCVVEAARGELLNGALEALDGLDLLLTHGTLQAETRQRMVRVLEQLGGESEADRLLRTRVAR